MDTLRYLLTFIVVTTMCIGFAKLFLYLLLGSKKKKVRKRKIFITEKLDERKTLADAMAGLDPFNESGHGDDYDKKDW